MVTNIIRKVFNINSEKINRDGDLKPKGVKYTIRGDYDFNETFEHIFRERLKS